MKNKLVRLGLSKDDTMTKLKIIIVLVIATIALGISQAQGITVNETKKSTKRLVSMHLAILFSTNIKPAKHKVYSCKPGLCHFWVKGTMECKGTMRVKEQPNLYLIWIKRLECTND